MVMRVGRLVVRREPVVPRLCLLVVHGGGSVVCVVVHGVRIGGGLSGGEKRRRFVVR